MISNYYMDQQFSRCAYYAPGSAKPTCYAGGDKKLNKETPFHYNRVVQSLLQERKGVYGEEVMRSRPYKMDV